MTTTPTTSTAVDALLQELEAASQCLPTLRGIKEALADERDEEVSQALYGVAMGLLAAKQEAERIVKPSPASAVDAFRDAEREAWRDFERAPSVETRREHFNRLLAFLREVDTRAEALLGLAKERRP